MGNVTRTENDQDSCRFIREKGHEPTKHSHAVAGLREQCPNGFRFGKDTIRLHLLRHLIELFLYGIAPGATGTAMQSGHDRISLFRSFL